MSCECKLPPLKTVGPTTGHLRICVQLYCCCRHLTEVLSKGICALVLRLTALVAAVSPIDHGLHRLLVQLYELVLSDSDRPSDHLANLQL
jgi:hypothetical protein